MYDRFEISRVLVIAPKRVAEDTWTREHAKWDHLKDLRISKVLGNEQQRIRALRAEADIYVIGRDNVIWLINYYQGLRKGWPFDMIVIDEMSSFKNPQAKRFRALKKAMPSVSRVVGLTGTPSPNGLMDLWAEVYLLDQGERLGLTLGSYRERYFRPGARNGYVVYKWEPFRNAQKEIEDKISDICISMSAADYLKLPKRIDNVIPVQLSPDEMEVYKRMERDQLLQIEDDDIALSAVDGGIALADMGVRAPTMLLECDVTLDADGCAGFAFGGSEADEAWTALCLDAERGLIHYEGYELTELNDYDPMAITRFDFPDGAVHHVKLVCENEIVVIYVDDEKALSSRIGHSTNGAHIGVFAEGCDAAFTDITMKVPE